MAAHSTILQAYPLPLRLPSIFNPLQNKAFLIIPMLFLQLLLILLSSTSVYGEEFLQSTIFLGNMMAEKCIVQRKIIVKEHECDDDE